MKKLMVLLFVGIGAISQVNAQTWGVGVRGGEPSGVSVKYYFGDKAIEGVVGTGGFLYLRNGSNGYYKSGGLHLMLSYLKHADLDWLSGLQWYWGITGISKIRRFVYVDDASAVRVTGIRTSLAGGLSLGLEYTFPQVPIAVFADVIPNIELLPDPIQFRIDGSIGIRYNF